MSEFCDYMCQSNEHRSMFNMDSKTPLNVHLSAFYKRSFAFHTVKERLPVILTKLIDYLVRDREKIVKSYGESSAEELKSIIGELSKLKYELQTNKPIAKLNSTSPDIEIYNSYIDELSNVDGVPRYFSSIWLFVECYLYRRINNIFNNSMLNEFDYYKNNKCTSFIQSLPAILGLTKYFIPTVINTYGLDVKSGLMKLLKINLWSNKCDLSISAGSDNSQMLDPLTTLETYDNCILCNHSEKIWEELNDSSNGDEVIDFINDNAGYELFADFCLADYLITHGFAKKIVFNVKQIPWFISDATEDDVIWILNKLITNKEPDLQLVGKRWKKYIDNGTLAIKTHHFWTLPFDYTQMRKTSFDLYESLMESKLLIFKGDLNYRKLFGEINWDPTISVKEALRGFRPAKLCSLRTLKSDIVVGLEKSVVENVENVDETWLVSGKYGVIQFCD